MTVVVLVCVCVWGVVVVKHNGLGSHCQPVNRHFGYLRGGSRGEVVWRGEGEDRSMLSFDTCSCQVTTHSVMTADGD